MNAAVSSSRNSTANGTTRAYLVTVSVAPLLGFVDQVIGRILDTPIEGTMAAYEIPFQPLKADPAKPRIEQAVELLVVPPEEEAKADKAEMRREKEAALLARRLAELHRGPE